MRSEVKTGVKAAEAAAGTEGADAALTEAITLIDRAARKGVIHRNAAARQKSRLVKRTRVAAS